MTRIKFCCLIGIFVSSYQLGAANSNCVPTPYGFTDSQTYGQAYWQIAAGAWAILSFANNFLVADVFYKQYEKEILQEKQGHLQEILADIEVQKERKETYKAIIQKIRENHHGGITHNSAALAAAAHPTGAGIDGGEEESDTPNAGNFSPSAESIRQAIPIAVAFQLFKEVSSDPILVTDSWTYWNTNSQTIFGALGIVTIPVQFLSSAYYYSKKQKMVALAKEERLKDFQTRKFRNRLREAAKKNKICQPTEIVIENPGEGS